MDRTAKYLNKYLDGFLFAPLSLGELPLLSPLKTLAEAEIPFREEDILEFKESGSLSHAKLTENIVYILGIDPNFRYAGSYKAYLKSFWGEKIRDGILRTGQTLAGRGEFERACIFFRAGLAIDGHDAEMMYQYAHSCRQCYLSADSEGGPEAEEYIGYFKAEAMDYFERCTIEKPDFADAYYYLGYAYANLGLYTKAKLAWESFLDGIAKEAECADEARNEESADMVFEIKGRLGEIKGPVEIEGAFNDISRGAFDEGLAVLPRYRQGRYEKWWPLYYYLGLAYEGVGLPDEAIESFLAVLGLNASQKDSMAELAELYEIKGKPELAKKYREKLKLV